MSKTRFGTSLVAQTVKRLSTMRETQVRSLGLEDPLEEKMAIYSSSIAWKIPRTEELGRLQSMGSQRVGHDWATSLKQDLSVKTWGPCPPAREPGDPFRPSFPGFQWNDVGHSSFDFLGGMLAEWGNDNSWGTTFEGGNWGFLNKARESIWAEPGERRIYSWYICLAEAKNENRRRGKSESKQWVWSDTENSEHPCHQHDRLHKACRRRLHASPGSHSGSRDLFRHKSVFMCCAVPMNAVPEWTLVCPQSDSQKPTWETWVTTVINLLED